jgi:hypothetical protein
LKLAYENNHYNIVLLLLKRREVDLKIFDKFNKNIPTIIPDHHWDMQGMHWKYTLYLDSDNFNY